MPNTLPPQLTMGPITLTVRNLSESIAFYTRILKFVVHEETSDKAMLGSRDRVLVKLHEDLSAIPLMPGRTGLYHFAILVPNRVELARVLHSIATTNSKWQGAADHYVSEALYFADPDGNGIEVYRDRPRSEWPYDGDQLLMGTDQLDLQGLLGELADNDEPWDEIHPDTVMGHIHLHVNDIAQAEHFYTQVLGFELVLRYGDSASFLAVNGYHHHLGMNTWAGVGAPPPPENGVGMRWFDILLPDEVDVADVVERLDHAGIEWDEQGDGILVRDPAGNGVRFCAPE